jgi:hypothetical protein
MRARKPLLRVGLILALSVFACAGAFADAASAAPVTVVPTRFDDPAGAGNCPSDCSLRQAVAFIQATGGTVDLTNAPTALKYTLSQGTLTINPASGNSITILGPNPRLVTITDQGGAGTVINVAGQTASISGVTITGGTSSGNGGGITNAGTLTLNNDQITGNSTSGGSVAGGGIYNNGPALTISNSTVTANTATGGAAGVAEGGGIASNTGTLKISNSTITANTATNSSPVPTSTATGGGIWQSAGGTMVLANVTLNGNTASSALLNQSSGGNLTVLGSVTVKNTIVSGGTASTGQDCSAATTSGGYNLEDDSAKQCGFTVTGDQTNVDPQLNTLGNATSGNGFTDVETVKATSPVIDAGNPNGCTDALGNALSTDQVANPRGTPCDIGAFETSLPPVLVSGPAVTGTPQSGQLLACSGANFSGLPFTLTYAWLRNGTAIAGATSQTYTPDGPDIGQAVACAVTATNVDGRLTATSNAVTVTLPPLPPFDGMTLSKTRFTLRNSQVILPVQCSKVAIFGCGGIVKISVASANASAAAKKKKRKHHTPAVPHPTTLGTATFKFNTAVAGTIPVLISHDGKLEIASRPHGRQVVTIQFLAYDGLYRQKVTTYSGQITAPASTVSKKHKRKR